MRIVSRFESHLLQILHFFLGRAPREQALPLVETAAAAPRCLSRPAVELIQQALARGCVQALARSDGWRPERYLRGERVAAGRLWERTPPADLGLTFSGNTLRFLIWITAADVSKVRDAWETREKELTIGDQLLFFLAYAALHGTAAAPALAARKPFPRHGLCWLAYPADFAVREPEPDFAVWTSGPGALILEALQSRLLRRWLEMEAAKRRERDWKAMQQLGAAQERTLSAFLNALDGAGRRDLARFLFRAAANLLREGSGSSHWVGGLETAGPRLSDRATTHAAALAFVRSLDRLRRWDAEARTVGYFDEGYAAAQLYKSEIERWHAPALFARADELVRRLDPFRQT